MPSELSLVLSDGFHLVGLNLWQFATLPYGRSQLSRLVMTYMSFGLVKTAISHAGSSHSADPAITSWLGDRLKSGIANYQGARHRADGSNRLTLISIVISMQPFDNSHVQQVNWILRSTSLLATQLGWHLTTIIARLPFVLDYQGKFYFLQG